MSEAQEGKFGRRHPDTRMPWELGPTGENPFQEVEEAAADWILKEKSAEDKGGRPQRGKILRLSA